MLTNANTILDALNLATSIIGSYNVADGNYNQSSKTVTAVVVDIDDKKVSLGIQYDEIIDIHSGKTQHHNIDEFVTKASNSTEATEIGNTIAKTIKMLNNKIDITLFIDSTLIYV